MQQLEMPKIEIVTEEDICAYLDGELDPEDRAIVEACLREDERAMALYQENLRQNRLMKMMGRADRDKVREERILEKLNGRLCPSEEGL